MWDSYGFFIFSLELLVAIDASWGPIARSVDSQLLERGRTIPRAAGVRGLLKVIYCWPCRLFSILGEQIHGGFMWFVYVVFFGCFYPFGSSVIKVFIYLTDMLIYHIYRIMSADMSDLKRHASHNTFQFGSLDPEVLRSLQMVTQLSAVNQDLIPKKFFIYFAMCGSLRDD